MLNNIISLKKGKQNFKPFFNGAVLRGCAAAVLPVEGAGVALTVVVLVVAAVGGLDVAVVGLDVADAGRDLGGPAMGLQKKQNKTKKKR